MLLHVTMRKSKDALGIYASESKQLLCDNVAKCIAK